MCAALAVRTSWTGYIFDRDYAYGAIRPFQQPGFRLPCVTARMSKVSFNRVKDAVGKDAGKTTADILIDYSPPIRRLENAPYCLFDRMYEALRKFRVAFSIPERRGFVLLEALRDGTRISSA